MSIVSLLCTSIMAISIPRAEYACRYMDTLVKAAEKNDIEPEILISLIHEESRWKPWSESKSGACGLTQVLPKYTKPAVKCRALKRASTSIRVGARTLSYWVHKYGGGDYEKGLCGYNGGYRCGSKSKLYARRIIRLSKKISERVIAERAFRTLTDSLRVNTENPPELKLEQE